MELLRHVNVFLTMLVFAGLVWRLVGRWTLSFRLGRLVTTLFALLYLFISLGTARAAAGNFPVNEIQVLIGLHALATLAVIATWPRLLPEHHPDLPGNRRRSP